jgi:hypothetical protein
MSGGEANSNKHDVPQSAIRNPESLRATHAGKAKSCLNHQAQM